MSEFHKFLISMFHILVLLNPSLTLIQNLSNSLGHIYHSVSPFPHPIPFSNRSVLHNNQVHQKIGSARSFVVAGGLVPGGIGNFSAVAAAHSVFAYEGTDYFAYHHPSPLLCFCILGSLIPIHTPMFALGS